MEEISFCQRCGSLLEDRFHDGQMRSVCTACGAVVFLNPKVVAAVITEMQGRVVMVRRKTNPGAGKWSLPAGFVDRGEVVEEAASREVREETGLEVEITELVGLYSRPGDTIVLAVYAGTVVGGELKAGEEVQAVDLFDVESLPPLAFERDAAVIQRWSDGRR